MSRYTFIVGVSVLAFAAAPAFAQTKPMPAPMAKPAPAQGMVQPRHMTHPAPAHKMPMAKEVSPDHSADMLNGKELASIQHGAPAAPPAMPMPAAKP